MRGLHGVSGAICRVTWLMVLFLSAFSAGAADMKDAITRGRDFLRQNQNKDGSWGNATQTKALNLLMPAPGGHRALRCAVTALCTRALIYAGNDADRKQVNAAKDYLIKALPDISRCSPSVLYNVWTHAYGIQALLQLDRSGYLSPAEKKQVQELVKLQLKRLETFSTAQGGWAYYNFGVKTVRPSSRPVSFTSAVILVAIHEAREAGYHFSPTVQSRALRAVLSQRKPDSSYLYSQDFKYFPQHVANQPAGSLGRTQACNYGLSLFKPGAVSVVENKTQLTRFISRNGWLDIGRKRPRPHEAWFSVAGYYFYFGHYYAALNAGLLPESDRQPVRDALSAIMIENQEKDGSWWDFPMYNYHKYYGTAFALMTLAQCKQP